MLARIIVAAACGLLLLSAASLPVRAQDDVAKLEQAAEVLRAFTADDENGIPVELLQQARGIAIVPNLIRGGFILGGRRGRGVLAVRMSNGEWSNPAVITVTGGSIGWQFGVESADLVLIFANDRSVRNIEDGRFTLGGEAAAVAGPLGRRSSTTVTARSEIYAYLRSRGLFAGAAVEGARLDVDEQGGRRFYGREGAVPLRPVSSQTPSSVRQFLDVLTAAARPVGVRPAPPAPSGPRPDPRPAEEEATIFPLEPAP